jgi:type II secretory pathway predicted ATPase ExeA
MYYAHFGLKEPPFKITPNTEVFYTGGKRGAVLDALIYAILNGEGIIKVVGEVGSGKTMLCRMLQTILPEKIESIYLANPSVEPEDILHAIAFELQLKLPKNADRLKVMQVLQSHLLARHAAGKQVVIFVEEAQGMPLATLEEIRLLSNLETNHDKLLQIVLFGQPELDDNLNQTHIRQLRERITHSFNLAPLQPKEISEYLMFRLRAAGYFGPHLFTKSAINSIASSAQGLVRRVNILADKALLAAFADNVYQVTQKQVSAAIKDSEFGAEKAKLNSKSSQILMWLGLLLFGLVSGYWLSAVLQKPVLTPIAVKPTEFKQGMALQSVETILNRRLAVTESWLAKQPPTTVSIQLLGGYSDKQVL